ncbi:MAG TPA: RNA polymerase sigma factor [Opitutales bacterium]|jgi:RNA polymerase sigma factor (sigma-70 family)|nr:RNA polymerase sigma factor [Opitutales bacterium]
MTTNCELLRRYAEKGDQAAFTQLVRQNVDLVYSSALRQMGGDAHRAQDVTQSVFAELARKARTLSTHPSITGWLYTTTKFTACKLISGDCRRLAREQEAATMQDTTQVSEPNWDQLRPLLDEAVCQLEALDREAVLMRFFQNKSHREVGDVLGLSEDTARKRGERALEKIRSYFARRGITVSAALLATAISVNSVQAAPQNLVNDITAASLITASKATFTGTLLTALFMSTKTKTILAIITLVAVVAFLCVHFYPAPEVQPPAVITKSSQPKPPVASKSVEAPAVAMLKPAQPVAADPANDRIQAELNAVIDDMASMYESGDWAGMINKYLSPDELAKQNLATQDAAQVSQAPQQAAKAQAMQQMPSTPQGQQVIQGMVQMMLSMKTQSPELNATGDEATYQVTKPATDLGYGVVLPGGLKTVVFQKIDGRWYILRSKTTAF